MAGLVLIVISVIIAVFGYFLAPDPSPYANRIILEIGGEKPGFHSMFFIGKKRTGTIYAAVAKADQWPHGFVRIHAHHFAQNCRRQPVCRTLY